MFKSAYTKSIEDAVCKITSLQGRIALLGAGSSLNSDDAAGPAIAEKLIKTMQRTAGDSVQVYNGCTAPENFTGDIKRFKPDILFIIDAADFGESPGSVRELNVRETEGVSFSSHMLPIKIMALYLEKETGCKTVLLGIQPESVSYGEKMSVPVARSVRIITGALKREIRKRRESVSRQQSRVNS